MKEVMKSAGLFLIAVCVFLLGVFSYHAGQTRLCIIFVTIAVTTFACGFIPFSESEINHAPLWFVVAMAILWLIPTILAREYFLRFLIAFLVTSSLGAILIWCSESETLEWRQPDWEWPWRWNWRLNTSSRRHSVSRSEVPKIVYHGTSREAAYHILQTRLFKIRTGLWVTTDLKNAWHYARQRGGSDGLIVEFMLKFSRAQFLEYAQLVQSTSPTKDLLDKGYRIVRVDDTVYLILADETSDANEYMKIPGVKPRKLLDQNGGCVAKAGLWNGRR